MDQKNDNPSFLDLLEHMKSYLGAAGRIGRELEERLKSLTGAPARAETPCADEPEED